MPQVVAILETMYVGRTVHPETRVPYFTINAKNKSGKMLYSLLDYKHPLLVTNACPELVRYAHEHGTPDPTWLRANLTTLAEKHPFQLLLVCGKVAQKTFKKCGFELPPGVVSIDMPHPAWRAWTQERFDELKAKIEQHLQRKTT
jgi:hypothetical protein